VMSDGQMNVSKCIIIIDALKYDNSTEKEFKCVT